MSNHHCKLIFALSAAFLLGEVTHEAFSFVIYPQKLNGYQLRFGKRLIEDEQFCLGVTTSTTSYSENDSHHTWKEKDEMIHDLMHMNESMEEYIDWHVPVVLYDGNSCSKEGETKRSCQPKWFRNTCTDDNTLIQKQEFTSLPTSVQIADKVTEETMRWCQHFVLNLNLCPWAKSSLLTRNAIRIKIVPQSAGWDTFEEIARSSAMELLRITPPVSIESEGSNVNDCADNSNCQESKEFLDPNAAITFIVAAPNHNPKNDKKNDDIVSWGYDDEFHFSTFYENFVDFEEAVLDEADEAESSLVDEDTSNSITKESIGDHVTFAPFHPDWAFSSDDSNEYGKNSDNPVDYEKRTPYPTVSLVRTSAVMAAGEETTIRIGHHNEEVLNKLGSQALESIFQNQVLQNVDTNQNKKNKQ